MRFVVRLMGLDILDVELSTEASSPASDDSPSRDLSGGTTSSTPMGFVAHMERPHEATTPDRDW